MRTVSPASLASPGLVTLVAQSSGSGTSQQQSGSVSGSTSGGGAGAGQTSILSTNGPEGDIEHMTVAHLTAASQGAYTLAEGQLVSSVTAVTWVRGDGVDVVASTGSGWFAAWWPASAGVISAHVTTAGGVTTQPSTAHCSWAAARRERDVPHELGVCRAQSAAAADSQWSGAPRDASEGYDDKILLCDRCQTAHRWVPLRETISYSSPTELRERLEALTKRRVTAARERS